MPPTRTTSALMQKLTKRVSPEVYAAHVDDPVDEGFIRLPGGIANGVAQLTKAYFAEYKTGNNKGEVFFRAQGTVIEPEVNDKGVRVRGLQTSVLVGIHASGQGDKAKTAEDQLALVQNHMKLLGGEDFLSGTDVTELETLAGTLVELAPYFRFSSRESSPVYWDSKDYEVRQGKAKAGDVKYEARVWESWHGVKGLEGYVPPDEQAGAANDNTATATPAAKVSVSANGKPAPAKAPLKAPPKTAPEPTPDPEPDPDPAAGLDQGDLDSLAELADGDTDAAQDAIDRLEQMALAAGVQQAAIDGSKNWAEVAQMIKDGGADASQDDEPAETDPAKGMPYYYKRRGPDGEPLKDKRKKPVKGEAVVVLTVDAAKRTATLKLEADGATLVGPNKKPLTVPWDHLDAEE